MTSLSSLATWLARVEHAFVPPHLRGDPVASRTASLVVGFSLLPILFVPLLAIMEWLAFPPGSPIAPGLARARIGAVCAACRSCCARPARRPSPAP
jgi:hypothetical protein